MGFRLDDMIGKYKDFARGYLFYANVTGPVPIDADHPYLVNAANLPAQSIEPITTNWQGNEYKIGGTNTFAEFTLTFKADVGQDLRTSFLQWMQQVHDPVSNVHGIPSDYFGTVMLTQINTQGEAVMSYNLVNAWPSGVGEVSLDYGNKEISTFDVTFTYQYHVVDDIFDNSTTTTNATAR